MFIKDASVRYNIQLISLMSLTHLTWMEFPTTMNCSSQFLILGV